MSDSQAYEEVTVASDGVSVVKRFEEDEFPVPAIAFEFDSNRDEEVTVRLVDRVPEGVAVEDLGFHPEYGSEYWTIDEDEISFERDLGANAEYTTVYGIRATGTDDVEQFLTQPEIDEVEPPLPDDAEDVIPESDDDVVRDVISGEADNVPGLDDEDGEDADEDIETLDLKDPNEEGGGESGDDSAVAESTNGAAADDDESGDDADDAGADADAAATEVSLEGENLTTALAAEIRQNNVSAEDVKLLRQAFEIAGQEGGSITARLDRVQADVSKLRSYTDAMEEFLDENGTAQQLIEDVQSDIADVEETVSSMRSTVEENDGELADLAEQVDSMNAEVEDVRGEIDEVHDEVEGVTEEVEEVGGEVDEVSETVADVEETVSTLEETVADLEDNVSDEDVADRVGDIEDEIEDLREWQEQIKSTFGG